MRTRTNEEGFLMYLYSTFLNYTKADECAHDMQGKLYEKQYSGCCITPKKIGTHTAEQEVVVLQVKLFLKKQQHSQYVSCLSPAQWEAEINRDWGRGSHCSPMTSLASVQ